MRRYIYKNHNTIFFFTSEKKGKITVH